LKKIKDHYFHKAKRDGYVARSAYKLEEIDKKHRLLRKGNLVLDLGCSPGSWLQYAAGKVGEQGQVLGVDLQTVKLSLPKNVKVLQADIFEMTVKDLEMNGGMVDVILRLWSSCAVNSAAHSPRLSYVNQKAHAPKVWKFSCLD